MFGLTAGAVFVYLRGKRYSENTLFSDLAIYSSAFAVSIVVALAFQMTLAPGVLFSVTSVLVWIEMAVFLAVPFFFAGIVISLALTRSPYPIGRVYGADLLGAAVGCFGVLFLLDLCSGPSAVLWTSVVVAFGAILFSRSKFITAQISVSRLQSVLGWHGLCFLILIAIAVLNTMDNNRVGLYPLYVKNLSQLKYKPQFEKWNSFSRVIVYPPAKGTPFLWGPSPLYYNKNWLIEQSSLNIDGNAGTVAYGIGGDLSKVDFLKYDVANLAYYLPNRQSAAIIGVGAGRDILSALKFGVQKVTGVEINPIFIDLLLYEDVLKDFIGLNKFNNITLVVDEARSWFSRNHEKFDVIQMSLIDTWAATGAGAYTLSENGLYTIEAWKILLESLSSNGVLTVSRWYSPENVSETGRLVSLATATLIELGVENPRNHIILISSEKIANILVSRNGFNANDLKSLEVVINNLKFNTLILPDLEPSSAVLASIINSHSLTELNYQIKDLSLDLTPPTDEKPFFFNQLPLNDIHKLLRLWFSGQLSTVGKGNFLAISTLLMIFLISFALVIATILIPLRLTLSKVGNRLATGGTLYFMLIGMGFMFVEIGLLQRFTVFLGHPMYSLSIVLFSLILSTGIGSLTSDYIKIEKKSRLVIWATITFTYIISQVFWVPQLLHTLDSGTLILRGLVSIAIIMPAGLLMGYGFPTGMRLVTKINSKPTPWFWGINGASGVLASTLAVVSSIAYGISTTLIMGAVCYLILIPAAFIIGFTNKVD